MPSIAIVRKSGAFVVIFASLALALIQAQTQPGSGQDINSPSSPQAAVGSAAAGSTAPKSQPDDIEVKGKDSVQSITAEPQSADEKHAGTSSEDAKNGKESGTKPWKEDWETLAVPRGLPVPDPVSHLDGNFPDFTREYVRLEWRRFDPIDAYIIKPKGVEKPPVILYLYSFPSDTHRFIDDQFAKTATKNGFAAVGFVSALTGERYHDIPMKEWFISKLAPAMTASVHDVQMMLNYLASRGDLDVTNVGMFSDGSGASIAIMSAAVDPRIKVLDLVDAWGDWPDWLAKSSLIPGEERANYLKPEFLTSIANVDPLKWLPQLKTQHLRFQYLLTGDTVTPPDARLRMEKAAPSGARMVYWANAASFVASVGGPSGEKMFDWVKEKVRAADEESGTQNAKAPSPSMMNSDR